MSYPNGTILTRTDQKGTRFDRIRVIGPSPIRTAQLADWGGAVNGDLILAEPLGKERDEETGELKEVFSATEMIPLERLYSDYDVEFEPELEPTHVEAVTRSRTVRQLTPEEQFRIAAREAEAAKAAEEADGEPAPPKRTGGRKRTPIGSQEGEGGGDGE